MPMSSEKRKSVTGTANSPFSLQLALLDTTAVALSVASGWTTWDGMTNFTDSEWLSLLITFGIQGVLLTTAWLIGETFARQQVEVHAVGTGSRASRSVRLAASVISFVALLMLVAAILSWFDLLPSGPGEVFKNNSSPAGLTGAALMLLLIATLLSHRDIGDVYLASGRTILRNLPLWVMFLMCMAASVFFSFDSLFTRIFPPSERSRSADIRAQRDLAVVLAEARQQVAEVEADAVDAIFTSEAWKRYSAATQQILASARTATEALRDQRAEEVASAKQAATRQRSQLARLEAEQRTLKARQERQETDVAASRDNLVRIDARVSELTDKLSATINSLQDAQTAMESELQGVGRTGVAGRGPVYRELKRQTVQLQIDADALRRKLEKQTASRVQAAERIVRQEAAAAKMAGDLAQLASEISIKANQTNAGAGAGGAAATVDTIKAATSRLTAAKLAFEQSPTAEDLVALQRACSESVVSLTGSTTGSVGGRAGSRCETDNLKRLVAAVAMRRQVTKAFAASCGKSAIPVGGSASELIDVGRRCVRVAALDGPRTTELGGTLNRIALRRDDAAHRFVVSTNAFLDANQLAYLALAIAIAIDALIFISGLFGAAAAAVPNAGRGLGQNVWAAPIQATASVELSDQQALISVATAGAHRDIAETLLSQANPIMPDLGYTHSVPDKKYPKDIVSTLNAGIAAGVVHWKQDPEPQYLISPAFFVALVRPDEAVIRTAGEGYSAQAVEDDSLEIEEEDGAKSEAQVLQADQRSKKEEMGSVEKGTINPYVEIAAR